jgi:cyanobactin maturation PatA/PatG family protease
MESVEANAAFAERFQFPFRVVSDPTGEVCQAFGACKDIKTGRIKRNTYVIGPAGTVLRVFEDVDPAHHAETVLAFLSGPSNPANQEISLPTSTSKRHRVYEEALKAQKGEQPEMNDRVNETAVDQACGTENGVASGATREQAMREPVGASSSLLPSAGGPAPQDDIQSNRDGEVQPAQQRQNLVYALGTLGYDFGTEARRDSIMQHVGTDLLDYLGDNPWEAAAIHWTLNLDVTPIYAVKPLGPFAGTAFQRLVEFLGEQNDGVVERVSIPGYVEGSARLFTGQVVPVIRPDLRGMYSWNTQALVEAVCGPSPGKDAVDEERDEYAGKVRGVENFLRRVYDELRNLGTSPQERAINYAATNAFQATEIFRDANLDGMELDTIEVARSPICRQYSDCWDVKLTFFHPGKVFEQARKVYRFTEDVSDVVPVAVGPVRSWFVR